MPAKFFPGQNPEKMGSISLKRFHPGTLYAPLKPDEKYLLIIHLLAKKHR